MFSMILSGIWWTGTFDGTEGSAYATEVEAAAMTNGCLQVNGTGLAGNFNLGGYYLSPDGTAKGLTLFSDGMVRFNYGSDWGAQPATNATSIQFSSVLPGRLYQSTADGTDNKHISISGGGAIEGVTRGAYVYVAGNEDAYPGQIWLSAGNVANGKVVIATSNEQERITVLQNGNVGIGTNTPGNKLHVNGSIRIGYLIIDGNAIVLSPAESSYIYPGTLDGSDNRSIYYCGGGAMGSDRGAFIRMDGNEGGIQGKGCLRLYAGYDDALMDDHGTICFYTSNQVQRVKIDRAGNVGIGNVSTPARPLHVQDVMRLEPRATYPESAGAGDIFYHSTSNKLYCYDGSTWQACF